MNIIYFHGLESNFEGSKPTWLRNHHSCRVFRMNYAENDKLFTDLDLYISKLQLHKDNKIDLLIGSSMGGFFAMAFGIKHKIPYLVFNPPIDPNPNVRSINHFDDYVLPIIKNIKDSHPSSLVVLGEVDDVVDPDYATKFCTKNGIEVNIVKNMGHRVPLKVMTDLIGAGKKFDPSEYKN